MKTQKTFLCEMYLYVVIKLRLTVREVTTDTSPRVTVSGLDDSQSGAEVLIASMTRQMHSEEEQSRDDFITLLASVC